MDIASIALHFLCAAVAGFLIMSIFGRSGPGGALLLHLPGPDAGSTRSRPLIWRWHSAGSPGAR